MVLVVSLFGIPFDWLELSWLIAFCLNCLLVPSLNHKSYHNFYHKFDHTCGLGVQGKLSWRTWHYPRCTGEAIVAYLALSKGGYRVHYPRVATIQGWIWGPLCKGGHYPWEHYPRVATIQESVKWQLLSKAFFFSTVGIVFFNRKLFFSDRRRFPVDPIATLG